MIGEVDSLLRFGRAALPAGMATDEEAGQEDPGEVARPEGREETGEELAQVEGRDAGRDMGRAPRSVRPMLFQAGGLRNVRSIPLSIESEMAGLPDMVELRSLSKFGLSQVTMTFRDGVDLYRTRQLVTERLQSVLEDLPHREEDLPELQDRPAQPRGPRDLQGSAPQAASGLKPARCAPPGFA